MARVLTRLVEKVLDGLPGTDGLVLVLGEVEGLDAAEIAALLGVSAEVVETRLHRGRAIIRGHLMRELAIATREAFQLDASRCDRVVARVLEAIAAKG